MCASKEQTWAYCRCMLVMVSLQAAMLALHPMRAMAEAEEAPAADTYIGQAIRASQAIKTLSCEITKTIQADGQTFRMLSRVHFRAPQSVHIENAAPSQRRILSDGNRLYYHEASHPRGFSRPLADLPPAWRYKVDNVPGTALEHILRLRDLPEEELAPGADGLQRFGYETPSRQVILHVDDKHRLVRITFHPLGRPEEIAAQYRFSRFQEVTPGYWIPLRHEAELPGPDGETITEVSRISRLEGNAPMPDLLFDHRAHFPDVTFTDNFEDTFPANDR